MKLDKSFGIGFITGTVFSFVITVIVLCSAVLPMIFLKKIETAKPRPASYAPGVEAAQKQGETPRRGNADAPVVITEFADFHCPFCRRAAPTVKQLLEKYPGKIKFVFRHFPLSMTPGQGSYPTHLAAACAGDQKKFWEFYDAVFAASAPPKEDDLYTIARMIGLDESKFHSCLNESRYAGFLKQEFEEGKRRGVSGTPTFFVNGQTVSGSYPLEYFSALIEHELDPAKPLPASPEAAKPAPPAVVRFDDLKGKPSRGREDAPVTIVEFSDFHCPFCKKVEPAVARLVEEYPGKVRQVWRHFPLAMHQGAFHTHEASQCAAEQNKFWEYHDKLFEMQGSGSARDEAGLVQIAKDLGLNKKKFSKCLASGKYRDMVQKEITAGEKAGVNATPSVFVNGKLMAGAQPYENFKKAVEKELGKA